MNSLLPEPFRNIRTIRKIRASLKAVIACRNQLLAISCFLVTPAPSSTPQIDATTPSSALRRAGVREDLRFHDLRHTCATLLLREGVNPKVVSEMLGHASITITLNTYSHVLPDMQNSAANAMEAALGAMS